MDDLQVGDWVIQYSAGYWKITKILPKYADFDYDSQHIHWKKGDLIGHWAIVKKAFTPKMKPSVRCECVDLSC